MGVLQDESRIKKVQLSVKLVSSLIEGRARGWVIYQASATLRPAGQEAVNQRDQF